MSDIFLYTQHDSPRLRYIGFFLSQYFGLRVEVTTDIAAFRSHRRAAINYSPDRILPDEIHIIPSGLLHESGISPQQISMNRDWTWPIFFTNSPAKADLPFDIFSAIFFLITRYEEYLPFAPDTYGRFPAAQSLAFREYFLQLPLVDLWLDKLKSLLLQPYPQCPFQDREYNVLGTYDIDQAWAYLHKGWKRNVGGLIRAFLKRNFQEVRHRLSVWAGSQADPFEVYSILQELHHNYQIPAQFFFPMGPNGPLDKNHQPSNTHYQNLILALAQEHSIGLHPSVQSNSDKNLLRKEKDSLQRIIARPLRDSRQHYLMLGFPQTYRRLESIGIQRDFSMGYPDAIGFRASISRPYYWYDLERERISQLQVVPFQLMDVTLASYLRLSVEQAKTQTREMIAQTKTVQGQFCYIWHNSSFSDYHGWAGWEEVLRQAFLPI